RGYFNSQYLGYEAAEGLDWVWEHRIEDLAQLDLDKGPLGNEGSDEESGPGPIGGDTIGGGSPDRTAWGIHESAVQYSPAPGRLSSGLDLQEGRRLEMQRGLDRNKSQQERNQLGQFATPAPLADEIVQAAQEYLADDDPVGFLEPAFGTGSFFSALLRNLERRKLGRCQGYEIDPHYAKPAQELWRDTPLHLEIADFTALPFPESEADRYDLIATNPPYVRHHHLRTEDKDRLRARAAQVVGTVPSGLSGLYVYFIYLAHSWLRQGGIGAWLIPSEFMYVNYGGQLRDYLLNRVTLLRVHCFDPQRVQFDDALVSSSVVFFRKEKRDCHEVLFTYGGSLAEPELSRYIPVEQVRRLPKWRNLYRGTPGGRGSTESIRIGDIFDIKRGLATGANKFFVMTPERALQRGLPSEFLTPILPSPRYLYADEIASGDGYMPDIEEKRVLLSCDLPEKEIEKRYPVLWEYLEQGKREGIHRHYLCSHRSPWYSQETREAAPILCSYMGRGSKGGKPFRFFLNWSAAVAPNTYLNLYPKPRLHRLLGEQPEVLHQIFEALRRVGTDDLVSNGRTYGGGLHKMEPKELANVRIYLGTLAQTFASPPRQGSLFDSEVASE
ncbi:MAG: N-6 DNA methylase, partial [Anaerolineae bacterium]|nr:N-6 DNA methylase [Anaerolineae bacterium]